MIPKSLGFANLKNSLNSFRIHQEFNFLLSTFLKECYFGFLLNKIIAKKNLMFQAKIAIIKHDTETLEMSGRIDNAIMDDNFDTMPMKSVWPYLSIVLSVAVEYFDELSLQYIVNNALYKFFFFFGAI